MKRYEYGELSTDANAIDKEWEFIVINKPYGWGEKTPTYDDYSDAVTALGDDGWLMTGAFEYHNRLVFMFAREVE